MLRLRFVFCFLALTSLLMGCAKKATESGGSSQLSFSLPKTFGNGAFSGSACFAINIKAKDIEPIIPGQCDDQYGVFSGLVPLGNTIKLSAPRGKARVIEIFYVVSEEACEENFDPNQGLGQTFGANKVFRIGSVQADFSDSVVTVELPIQYPTSANSLKSIFQTPATCDQINTITVSSIQQARPIVGEVRGATNLGSKAHVRIVDKQIQLTAPTSWSGRIHPVRLGEEQ